MGSEMCIRDSLDAVDQLQRLIPNVTDGELPTITGSQRAARLRSILAQLKESLATWAGDSAVLTAGELQGLAELQSEFVEEQLKKVLPRGSRNMVRTVEISPQFAQAVVTTDPTQINVVTLSDDLFAACLLYTSPSPRDGLLSRMPSSA